MRSNLIIFLLMFILIAGCSKKEKGLSEAEKKIVNFSASVAEIVVGIQKFENYYSQNKNNKNWKFYYNQKRAGLDSLKIELDKIIQDVRFFERMPDEAVKKLSAELISACDNIKLYLNTTNADLSNYYTLAPPAFDPYNWDRLIVPAIKKLTSIIEKDKSVLESNKFKGTQYFLSQPGKDDINRQIQSSPQKMEEWKEEVESAIKTIPETKTKK